MFCGNRTDTSVDEEVSKTLPEAVARTLSVTGWLAIWRSQPLRFFANQVETRQPALTLTEEKEQIFKSSCRARDSLFDVSIEYG